MQPFVEAAELQMKGNVGLMMGKSERDGSPLAYSEAISLTWLSALNSNCLHVYSYLVLPALCDPIVKQ